MSRRLPIDWGDRICHPQRGKGTVIQTFVDYALVRWDEHDRLKPRDTTILLAACTKETSDGAQ